MTTATCEFTPPHEPWECRIHRGIRTSLDESQCDAVRPAVPLTEGQLANLREADVQGRLPHSGRYLIRGLLATIAADRADPDEGASRAFAAIRREVESLREDALRKEDQYTALHGALARNCWTGWVAAYGKVLSAIDEIEELT